MLLSFSPEGTFVLVLLELVLSGLAFVVLVWIQLREPCEGSPVPVRTLTAGFALLAAAFAGRALYCRLAVCPPASVDPQDYWLLFAAEFAQLIGATALVVGYLLTHGQHRWATPAVATAFALSILVATRFSADALRSVGSIAPLTTARAAEAIVLLGGAALVGRNFRLPAAAFLLLALARLTAAYAAWQPAVTEAAWAIEHLATLAALVTLALTLERASQEASLRFFLRLNLTFIVLASSLILIVAEIERRQFAEFAALQSEDLAEFVRGHMVYYTRRGESPDRVLTHDDVVRKLVAEFGRYPDLRRVQVSLGDRTVALAIDHDGLIDQRLWAGERATPPRVSPADFSVAPLLTLPIVLAGQAIGRVELSHSLERINERIGLQMQLVFLVFTLFVIVASGVTGMLVVAADQTIRRQYDELERTRRRLSVAERLASIGAVADGVAHEINNPAGILVARADYLLSVTADGSLDPTIRDDLATIRRQAQRIAKTVKDLLTFSRPAQLQRQPVAVHAVLEAALELVRPMILEKGLWLERQFDGEQATVCGDGNRLEQVFINLLTNAVHATSAGGQITVGTAARPAEGKLEILVRDTGSGIAPEHLDRIFDPFFTTKERGSGTGLGLSIAYGIIRDHGGTIDVASKPGVGSEFRVRLPLATPHCRASEAGSGQTQRAAAESEETDDLFTRSFGGER